MPGWEFLRKVHTVLLPVCLVDASTAVTLCNNKECIEGPSCCESLSKIYLDGWYGPLILCMLGVFSLVSLCWICNNGCHSEPPSAPPSPRLIPLRNIREPPSYSEVISKPFFCQPTGDGPPSYNSISHTTPTAPPLEGQR